MTTQDIDNYYFVLLFRRICTWLDVLYAGRYYSLRSEHTLTLRKMIQFIRLTPKVRSLCIHI